jgi:hypothetical protein
MRTEAEQWPPVVRERFEAIRASIWSAGYPERYAWRIELAARFVYLSLHASGYAMGLDEDGPPFRDRERLDWILARAGHLGNIALRELRQLDADLRADREASKPPPPWDWPPANDGNGISRNVASPSNSEPPDGLSRPNPDTGSPPLEADASIRPQGNKADTADASEHLEAADRDESGYESARDGASETQAVEHDAEHVEAEDARGERRSRTRPGRDRGLEPPH